VVSGDKVRMLQREVLGDGAGRGVGRSRYSISNCLERALRNGGWSAWESRKTGDPSPLILLFPCLWCLPEALG
jgi:hypothetical protein